MSEDVAYRLAELERKMANLLTIGTVSEADYEQSLVRVEAGDLVTGWVPWLTQRAGKTVSYSAPEISEQVILLAPGGELSRAIALPALYQDVHPAQGASSDEHSVTFADGARVAYDAAKGALTVNVTDSGHVEIVTGEAVVDGALTVTGSLVVNGDIATNGDVQADGDILADGNVEAAGDVADKAGSIADERARFDSHTHISNGPGAPTNPPTLGP